MFNFRWAINNAYGSGKLACGGSYNDPLYSEGKLLVNETAVYNIVRRALVGKHFPATQDGIYLVLASRYIICLFGDMYLFFKLT